MKTTTMRALSLVAGMAGGAVLTAAVVAGVGGAASDEPSATDAELVAAAATGSAAGGHNHGASGATSGHDHDAAAAPDAAPLVPLAVGCDDSDLPPHDGFQIGPACVSTPFGEVGAAEDNPQLLITDAPDEVAVGQAFTIKVSTRNLVRDRFLAAAQGGYYLESSTLDENGLVRGHFHTACRVLGNTDAAPQPDRQDVFVATEDGGGGATPDTVEVKIPGLAAAGEAQCTAWAGDGSHRIPMMVFANQMPAVDSVRIQVNAAGAAADANAADANAADANAADANAADAGGTAGAAEDQATQDQATQDAQGTAARQNDGNRQRNEDAQATGNDRRSDGNRRAEERQRRADQRRSADTGTGTGTTTDAGTPRGAGTPRDAGTSTDARTDRPNGR